MGKTAVAGVIAIGWIVFWAYWIITALKPRNSNLLPDPKKFFGIRLISFVVAIALALLLKAAPESFKTLLPRNNTVWMVLGLVIFCLGLITAVWARVTMGESWGMPMTARKDTKLVTSGPYRFIRHPIYTGMLLMALGSYFDVNNYWLLVFVVAAGFFIYSAINEEKTLQKQFPKNYLKYKSNTKMLIPFIF